MSFVLDTNTLIYFFKGMGAVAERLLAVSPSEVVVCAPVLFELEVGLAKSSEPDKRRGQLNVLLDAVQFRAFGANEAHASARIRAALEAVGHPIGPMDNLVAGSALAHGDILVTRNLKEFGRIEGLLLENWY